MISQSYQWGDAWLRDQQRDDRARARAIWAAILSIVCSVLKYIAQRCRIAPVSISNWRPWFERLTVGDRSYLQWEGTVSISDHHAMGWRSKRNWWDAVREASGRRIAPVDVSNHAQRFALAIAAESRQTAGRIALAQVSIT